MDLMKVEVIATVALFDLRLSEGELEAYEACIDFMLKTCDEQRIYEVTRCTVEELEILRNDLRELIKAHVDPAFLPPKYKD